MILQSLREYYQRKAELAPPDFEKKEIAFIIVLSKDGQFIDMDNNRPREGEKATERFVPQGVKRSFGIAANLLWDNAAYVLGVVTTAKAGKLQSTTGKLEKEQERTRQMHAAFIQRIVNTFPNPDRDAGVKAVLTFLKMGDFQPLYSHPLWEEVARSTANISFRLQGDTELICQREAVKHAVLQAAADNFQPRRCLITGETDTIARLHPAIKGVWGTQTSGGNIVSFNFDASESYGKKQGLNAPVGASATFAYTTALNHLLRKGSRQRMQVGDATTVFWAKKAHPVEDDFFDWIEEDRDDPDRHIQTVRALYAAPKTGAIPIDEDGTPFYILGLSPNAARIAIRFWHQSTVGELVRHIRQHFDDISIVHGPKQVDYLPLSRLLRAIAVQDKLENIPPNLAGDVMNNILAGTRYPRTLLNAAICRIRAEHNVDYPRAALVKAVLVRDTRFKSATQQEVAVSLDVENPSAGYRLGRLFAALEWVQKKANPGINAPIRDRFYGAASATPMTVFPHLLKLKNHHIAKLDNRGQVINLEKLIGQIIDGIDEFPAHLSLDDQGRFAIGYYHQRQAFYTKSEHKDLQEELP